MKKTSRAFNARVLQTVKVSPDESYNAFTGLAFFNDHYWIAYRVGKGHVSPESSIVICKSRDGREWKKHSVLSREGLDLRDPFISVVDNKLIVLAFSLKYKTKKPPYHFDPADSYFFMLEDDDFVDAGVFSYDEYKNSLWTLREYNGTLHVSGYGWENGHYRASIWSAKSLSGPWKKLVTFPDMQIPPNMGYSEVDFLFDEKKDGKIIAFLRVDRDSFGKIRDDPAKVEKAKVDLQERVARSKIKPAKGASNYFTVATSSPPYKEWDLHTFRTYLKGARAIQIADNVFLIIGRFLKWWMVKRRIS
ncbi:MAG: hypothetical protein ACTSVI_13535, partial [Promethearchaeota archaeon]